MRLPDPPLLAITDRRQATAPLEQVIEAALRGGCRWVSLREKDLAPAERVELLRRIVTIGRRFGATVLVHGDIEAARVSGADGVHLPGGGAPKEARRRLGDRALIGVSAHARADIARAAAEGADYVTLSPIFASASKPDYGPALGLDKLREAAVDSPIPIVALGGVTEATAAACLDAGAAGIAVMGAVMRATEPAAATARLVAAIREQATPPWWRCG